MKQRDKELYIDIVKRIAQQSRAIRLQVGALLVNDGNMVFGYNGTPAGWDNKCETEKYTDLDFDDDSDNYDPLTNRYYKLVTKDEVVHAEMNLFKKVANNANIIKGGVLFLTHSPCINCAKLFLSMGLEEVIYLEDYRSKDGLELLKRDNIKITKWVNDADISFSM